MSQLVVWGNKKKRCCCGMPKKGGDAKKGWKDLQEQDFEDSWGVSTPKRNGRTEIGGESVWRSRPKTETGSMSIFKQQGERPKKRGGG